MTKIILKPLTNISDTKQIHQMKSYRICYLTRYPKHGGSAVILKDNQIRKNTLRQISFEGSSIKLNLTSTYWR